MGSSTYIGESHLKFRKLTPYDRVKLPRYKVINKKLDYRIGEIHWRGGWRQYVFQADNHIDMSRSCQKEIIKKIDKLMKEWRDNHAIQRTKSP